MKKGFVFVLVLVLVASSLITIGSASGVTRPSVPEFTVTFVARPYDEPPTYSIDPYTGANITHPGYHVKNESIEVTIKNQPFTPYEDSSGAYICLHYRFRLKPSFGDVWTVSGHTTSSRFEYTVKSFALGGAAIYDVLRGVPIGGQLDFQVEALVGYYTPVYATLYQVGDDFHGQTSGWSKTQTLTMGENASIATPTLSPSQSTPAPNESASLSQNSTTAELPDDSSGVLFGFSWEHTALVALCVVTIVLVVADLLVHFKKRGGGQPA